MMLFHSCNSRNPDGRGFTLIELMVAMFLTVIVSLAVFSMYQAATGTYRSTVRELLALQAFRSATDRLEMELNSIIAKAGYSPADTEALVPAERDLPFFKGINDGIFRIRFRPKYIGFYCSLDGRTIDRIEYYYNPPEEEHLWNNSWDDDRDDPDSDEDGRPGFGPGLLVDDKGSFMVRKTFDKDMEYEYGGEIGAGVCDFANEYPTRDQYPRDPDARDTGHLLADEVANVTFSYLYTLPGDPKIHYAPTWPYEGEVDELGNPPDNDPMEDATGQIWPRNDPSHQKGLSYLTLPVAIEVRFTFDIGGFERVLTKTIYLYNSQWNEYITRPDSG